MRVKLGAVLVAVLLASAFVSSAGAFPQHDSGCEGLHSGNLWFDFVDGDGDWVNSPVDMRPTARTGYQQWETMRTKAGAQRVTLSDEAQNSQPAGHLRVVLRFDDAPGGQSGANGVALCGSTATIEINSNLNFNVADLQWVVAHEVGHVLGLSHTAKGQPLQSFGLAPIMATCLGDPDDRRIYQDDSAALAAEYPDGSHPAVTGDQSFEESTAGGEPLYWRDSITSSHKFQVNTAAPYPGGTQGSKYLIWDPDSSSEVITLNGDHVVSSGQSTGLDVDFRLAWRNSKSGTTTGYVHFKLERRNITYGQPNNTGCTWPVSTAFDWNDTTMGSLVAVGPAEQHASTTSWKWQDTNNTLASTFSRYKATVWSTNVYTSNPSNHALLRLENMRVRRINCGDC